MRRVRSRYEDAVLLLTAVYHWSIWGLLVVLVSSQFVGIVWDKAVTYQYVIYGQSPFNPPTPIAGTNDEPYSDRNLVCVPQGNRYVPIQLSAALRDNRLANVVNRTGPSIDGYRVCKRELVELDEGTVNYYASVCDEIGRVLGNIQDRCDAMGYNVTRDVLRIVDEDTRSDTTIEIPKALPVLVLPFWDNAVHAHYAIPGNDGMACLFRLVDLPGVANLVVRGATRASRDEKTREWLGRANGTWRNGWYEDGAGQRWYSDMLSSWTMNKFGIHVRHFDSHHDIEFNCSIAVGDSTELPMQCQEPPVTERWGQYIRVTDQIMWANQAAISNGTRFGFFLFEAQKRRTVQTSYSLEMFISNLSISLLLIRWFVGMATLANSYRLGLATIPSAGLGACISSSRTFNVLPLVLLPRLTVTLTAFWTAGCEFEGQQTALAEAWAAMYPGIAEFMLFYYSVLNFVAKLSRRRMSDALFGPTLLLFCLLHRFRLALGLSGLLGFDGRVSTIMMSVEVDALRLVDFFTTNAALRINGNVKILFYSKLMVLAVNLLPLLCAASPRKSVHPNTRCEIEDAIKICAFSVGGIGQSPLYEGGDVVVASGHRTIGSGTASADSEPKRTMLSLPDMLMVIRNRTASSTAPESAPATPWTPVKGAKRGHMLSSYELMRLGYLVYGGKYLMSYDDWYVVTSMVPLRHLEMLWNHRIVVFDVKVSDGCFHVCGPAQICRLDDARLRPIPFYAITVCAFK